MKSIIYILPLALLSLIQFTTAAVNGPCNPAGLGYQFGVCVSTSSCSGSGGTYTNGDCPNDPNNIKCCYEFDCNGSGTVCMWENDCLGSGGHTSTGFCAGPNNFKCCHW